MTASVVLLGVAFTLALVVHFIFGLPLGFSLLLFLVGWPLGGTLVTIDDDLPGGWSNPDGIVRPPWREPPFWGQIAGGCAVSAAGFAVDFGWRSLAGLVAWLVGGVLVLLATTLLVRK